MRCFQRCIQNLWPSEFADTLQHCTGVQAASDSSSRSGPWRLSSELLSAEAPWFRTGWTTRNGEYRDGEPSTTPPHWPRAGAPEGGGGAHRQRPEPWRVQSPGWAPPPRVCNLRKNCNWKASRCIQMPQLKLQCVWIHGVVLDILLLPRSARDPQLPSFYPNNILTPPIENLRPSVSSWHPEKGASKQVATWFPKSDIPKDS